MIKPFVIVLITLSFTQKVNATIDLNSAELQYLADHLTSEECRRLIAAAHFKSYEQPNSLDQAERKIPKDLSCIQQLHHWNSEPGEGKGESHEVLEHRLRQMGKYQLADWLGKTVFHELTLDLNRSLESAFKDLASDGTERVIFGPTLIPIIQNPDPTEWNMMDTFLYAVLIGSILAIAGFGIRFAYVGICAWRKNRKRKVKFKQHKHYDLLDGVTSESESEDKFDLRDHTVRIDSTPMKTDNGPFS